MNEDKQTRIFEHEENKGKVKRIFYGQYLPV